MDEGMGNTHKKCSPCTLSSIAQLCISFTFEKKKFVYKPQSNFENHFLHQCPTRASLIQKGSDVLASHGNTAFRNIKCPILSVEKLISQSLSTGSFLRPVRCLISWDILCLYRLTITFVPATLMSFEFCCLTFFYCLRIYVQSLVGIYHSMSQSLRFSYHYIRCTSQRRSVSL